MRKYGLIKDGNLLLSSVQLDGYKPVEYADVPSFDQTTHYVTQGDVVDNGDYILVSVEVKELELDDNSVIEEPHVEESAPFVQKPTTDQRLADLENVILSLML